MPDLDLKRLRELAEKATPGPWRTGVVIGDLGNHHEVIGNAHDQEAVLSQGGFLGDDDADYIAAMSPDVTLALLDEVDRLRKSNEWLAKSDSMACTEPSADCFCSGCMYAAEVYKDA